MHDALHVVACSQHQCTFRIAALSVTVALFRSVPAITPHRPWKLQCSKPNLLVWEDEDNHTWQPAVTNSVHGRAAGWVTVAMHRRRIRCAA